MRARGPRLAAITGSNEVFFAVISTTATLAAVFIPISFLPGQAGGVFSEFGFVLAFCVTLSSAVALTMAPMLASILDPGKPTKRMLKAEEKARESGKPIPEDGRITGLFHKVIDKSIRLPFLTLGVAMAFAVFALGASQTLTSTLTPPEDRGMFFIIALGACRSDQRLYEQPDRAGRGQSSNLIADSGEVKSVLSLIGRGGGDAGICHRAPCRLGHCVTAIRPKSVRNSTGSCLKFPAFGSWCAVPTLWASAVADRV